MFLNPFTHPQLILLNEEHRLLLVKKIYFYYSCLLYLNSKSLHCSYQIILIMLLNYSIQQTQLSILFSFYLYIKTQFSLPILYNPFHNFLIYSLLHHSIPKVSFNILNLFYFKYDSILRPTLFLHIHYSALEERIFTLHIIALAGFFNYNYPISGI